MMEIPSIFTPVDWSFAFYEGLNQHQDSTSRDKTYAELGCGNGWISIALAEKLSPLKVVFSSSVNNLSYIVIAIELGATSVIHLLCFNDITLLVPLRKIISTEHLLFNFEQGSSLIPHIVQPC